MSRGRKTFETVFKAVAATIRTVRPCLDEIEFQDRIAAAFERDGIEFGREVKIGSGFVDFLVCGVLVEVKTSGSAIEATRQVIGYLKHDPTAFGAIIVHTRGEAPRIEGVGSRPIQFLNVSFGSL